MEPPRILSTGFEPFAGDDVNPSADLVRDLAADPPPGIRLRALVLPVAFGDDVEDDGSAFAALRPVIDAFAPDGIVLTGLSARLDRLHVEHRAVNLRDSDVADNDGRVVRGREVAPGGPHTCFTTADAERLARALGAAGVPAQRSADAGRFVCNDLYYRTLLHARRLRPAPRVVFVHVPHHDPARTPYLSRDVSLRGLRTIVRELATEVSEADRGPHGA